MELQEQITALTAEKNQLQNMLENLNSEKIAIDQMWVSALRECLTAKKEVLMMGVKWQEKDRELATMANELGECKSKIAELQALVPPAEVKESSVTLD